MLYRVHNRQDNAHQESKPQHCHGYNGFCFDEWYQIVHCVLRNSDNLFHASTLSRAYRRGCLFIR